MKIGIGIDTGGTYTDAVVYDLTNKKVLGTAKALTTKQDLSIGILQALDALPAEPLKKAEIVSLSTTLATNACVEDRGGNAKLIFLGGDANVINKNGKTYGLPPSHEMYIQESYTKFSGEIEREPDWEMFCTNIESDFQGLDGVGIIEMNAMRNGAVVEKKAKELFLQKHDIPVICSHELFNELNCLQRGASALLNARLVPVIREFLAAIKEAMTLRGIKAELIIVRSDGSLMSEEFAHIRPVETLLCGPAASVLGSAYLAQESGSAAFSPTDEIAMQFHNNECNSIIVDMGGTTTDIALIKNGEPVTVTDGVRIGKWKTFVNGLYINTFGLGGDTAIHYKDAQLFLEDFRIVPICVAAAQHPQIVENLQALLESTHKHTHFMHEHYMLVKDIENNTRYTPEEKLFCTALKNGPLILKDAALAIPGKDMYNFNVSKLVNDGVVQICGLTPTDIMHIKEDFSRFSKEASMLAAQFVASNLGVAVEELCDQVYNNIKMKLYVNIVKVLLENNNSHYMKNGVSKEVEQLITESYFATKNNLQQNLLTTTFTTNFTLTGVGAPTRIFLHDVAKLLGTKAITPNHCEVANALGAIVGNVYATNVVEIRPIANHVNITGYIVYGNNGTKEFETLEEAEAFAVDDARNGAYAEARRRGATSNGEIAVTSNLSKNEAMARDGMVYLGSRAVARAVGGIM